MPTDPNTLTRIAARALLGGLGPVFLTADGKRRISAIRGPAPSIGGDTIEIICLDGVAAGDDQVISAIVDLLWLPNPGNCGVRSLIIKNGELVH